MLKPLCILSLPEMRALPHGLPSSSTAEGWEDIPGPACVERLVDHGYFSEWVRVEPTAEDSVVSGAN